MWALLKQCLGLGRRSRHSRLLQARYIKPIKHILKERTASLYSRIFNTDSPARDLSTHLLSSYLCTGHVVPGTLLDQVLSYGLSPLNLIFDFHRPLYNFYEDGVVDSLRSLLCHENFLKHYSEEHMLVSLLTRSFY